jgi:uncharacterized surface protein with fasciclin (FAS1) repeats
MLRVAYLVKECPMNTQDSDIVENAANAGNFNTLANALKAAGLIGTYKSAGPFTLFAPTDEAFEKLPPGTLNALLKDKAKLAAVINYHALRGTVLKEDLRACDSPSVQGGTLTIAANDEGFTVNGAKVSKKQIEASNGVIHAIDAVMMPEMVAP